MGVFIFMILIETSVFHLLLSKWNNKIAWWFSGVSLYAAIQAFGIARSIVRRPIQIIESQLFIPYGILAETTLALKDIRSIKSYDKQLSGQTLNCLSPFSKLEEPNILIELVKPYYIDKIYGGKKQFSFLLINVDHKDLFFETIQQLLNSPADVINKRAGS
jgi:hypothetical protein